MQVTRILGKMWLQLAQRPGQTMRIFGLPALLSVVFTATFPFMVAKTGLWGPSPTLAFILITVSVKIVLFGWAAVNFHRHVVLGEKFGAVAQIHGRLTARYALGLLFVTAICMAVFTTLRFTLATMASGSTAPDRAALVIYVVPLFATFATALRLAAPLPGLAVGIRYLQDFAAQEGHRLVFAGLAGVATAAVMLKELFYTLVAPPIIAQISETNASLIAAILLSALALIEVIGAAFAISLLSAVYRTFVEPADA